MLGLPPIQELRPGRSEILVEDLARTVRVVELVDLLLDPGARRAEGRRVQLVALDLGGPPLVAFDHEPQAVDAEGHRRRVPKRDAGNDLLRCVHVRDDVLDRPAAGGETGERQRGAYQLQHRAASDAVGSISRSLRKLSLEPLPELGGALELAEAPPVALGMRVAHRWHPEQSTGGWMWRSAMVCFAHSA